ncbi:glyoxylate/hydroxypyruvate reductase A [Klebsiella sp. BIGb0407]|uniref:2-hydroxyacid dehydrogenase n=1 Tax=Klebsiella sp. BIGb0407 TaxID=2940603 RepID=UPI0021689BBE|nr:glyoxylate/hydroxypyruvate reductase A [Klebsiella sp. BIGb0407]MCS3432696.1 glyoxylate/hydroxypyruvate reductase A [Klebsiella sp. BIGb0407]
MSERIILVDCDEPELNAELCAILQQTPGVTVVLPGSADAIQARYACCWQPDPLLLQHSPALKLVQAASAGVDHLPEAVFASDVALCRVVDDNFRHGMYEYALWGVLWFQRHFNRAISNQSQKIWKIYPQRQAASYHIGVMGLGEIGGYIAVQLSQLGYQVSGWSRNAKPLPGVKTYAGEAQAGDFLQTLDVLINLLPLTEQTRGILAKPLLDKLPTGAALINCGRGEHMVNLDVLEALNSGQLAGAVLDVFPVEPLEPSDPLWTHPAVVITPHMASSAPAEVIIQQLLENIQRIEAGIAINNQVDKARGY